MDYAKYLDYDIRENFKEVSAYIRKGYLDVNVLEVDCSDKLKTITDVYQDINILKLLFDAENAYIASLRVLGEKSKTIHNQLKEIRGDKSEQ